MTAFPKTRKALADDWHAGPALAELDAADAALKRIANLMELTMGTGSYSAEMREIAREALGGHQ